MDPVALGPVTTFFGKKVSYMKACSLSPAGVYQGLPASYRLLIYIPPHRGPLLLPWVVVGGNSCWVYGACKPASCFFMDSQELCFLSPAPLGLPSALSP